MNSPEDFEKRIKEERTLEANKKGIIGPSGKIATILRNLGEPIVGQTEDSIYDYNYDYDMNNHNSIHEVTNSKDLTKKIPTMNMDEGTRPNSEESLRIDSIESLYSGNMPEEFNFSTREIGYYFEGLNRGMHLEIKYDEYTSELIVNYKGYIVYKEAKGDLLAYSPQEEWEAHIEKLYKEAKRKQIKGKESEFENSLKNNEKQKDNWLQKMKSKWGIT